MLLKGHGEAHAVLHLEKNIIQGLLLDTRTDEAS